LIIENSGLALLSWSTDNTTKLQASPSSGTIPAGGSQSLTITIDMTNLALGSYTDTLTISSNDPDEALLDIEFLLQVVKPTTEIKLSARNRIQNLIAILAIPSRFLAKKRSSVLPTLAHPRHIFLCQMGILGKSRAFYGLATALWKIGLVKRSG
jgi:hypothetical protein